MSKQLKDMTFDELVDEATQEIHLGLLQGGGKGLRSAVWCSLNTILMWRKEQDAARKVVDKEPAKL